MNTKLKDENLQHMPIKVVPLAEGYEKLWDDYVERHPDANLYHLAGWKDVIEKTYGHKTHYLLAFRSPAGNAEPMESGIGGAKKDAISILGILPLVHIKHFLFGNKFISMPFADMGGVVADNEQVEKELITAGLKLAADSKAEAMELRQPKQLGIFSESEGSTAFTFPSKADNGKTPEGHQRLLCRSDKVRMILELPETPDVLMSSFKSKLRSQIRKPMKQGLTYKVGGVDLLDDFYNVFTINMRDLGSPVHSKEMIRNVLGVFAEKTRIVSVYNGGEAVAASLMIGFKNLIENPWASSLRQYSRMSPNMLLYWAMLEFACNNNYGAFDFGRSTPGEGTFKFKEQWGAAPHPLAWYYLPLNDRVTDDGLQESKKFSMAVRYWQKLPLSLSKILGPCVRKYIGL